MPTDDEGDSIVIQSFTALDSLDFAKVGINTDFSFSIEIDRALITKSNKGNYEFSVSLTDSENAGNLNTQTINLKIEYTKIEPEKTTTESGFTFDQLAS